MSFLSAKHDMIMEQGSLFTRVFGYHDSDNKPIDLTLFMPRMQVRLTPSTAATIISAVEDHFHLENYLTLGKILLDYSSNETSAFSFNNAVYDLELVPITLTNLPFAGGYTSLNIDVDNGSGAAVLTANGGTPFSVLSADDVIRLSAMENGTGTNTTIQSMEIASVTDTVITSKNIMAGTDNTDDTAVQIDRVILGNEARVIKLFSGRIRLAHEVTK